jgi:two-component system sensor histidine kinase/response regulator
LLEELRVHQVELEMQNEDLRRVQSDLEASRARYFDIYDLAPVGYVTVGVDGPILEANLRATTLFATSRSALIGRRFYRYIAPDSRDKYRLTRTLLLQTGEPQSCELRMMQPEGTLFWARFECTLAQENNVPVLRIVIVDIDEQKRLAEALRQANEQLLVEKRAAEDATRAKSEFLSSMSHEIRTPLNGVVGMAGLLMQTRLSAEQLSYARIVSDSAEALLGLVNNILDFSKIEAGRLELDKTPFDLERLIEDVLDIMSFKAHEKSVELSCWYPASAARRFLGDAGRMRQVLMNFISNAIKFTQSGYVLVEVEASAPAGGKCEVRLSVHDTGIGISEKNLSHLFTPFRQADASIARLYGGTGLGLSIVKQIVELMSGELSVRSIVGQGSTFSCKIPLQPDAAQPSLVTNVSPLAGLPVLVSGSQQMARFVIAEWCQRWGMHVEHCDLSQLTRFLSTAAQNGQRFQLVLIDAGLSALSGAVAAFHSSADTRATKLVLLTPDSLEQASKLKADAVLAAPVRAKVLVEALCQVVGDTWRPLPQPSSSGVKHPSPGPRALKVLVTDDNLVNQKLACALLAKLGCEVDTADDGADAVRKVGSTDYELVFMDCVMPGMDGFAATMAIRNLSGTCARVPIVALTACATEQDRNHCLAAGMNDFLTKPIRPDQLASCLTKWVKA